MVINQGLSAASRILPIIDQKNKLKNLNLQNLKNKWQINFNNVNFSYEEMKANISINKFKI